MLFSFLSIILIYIGNRYIFRLYVHTICLTKPLLHFFQLSIYPVLSTVCNGRGFFNNNTFLFSTPLKVFWDFGKSYTGIIVIKYGIVWYFDIFYKIKCLYVQFCNTFWHFSILHTGLLVRIKIKIYYTTNSLHHVKFLEQKYFDRFQD